MIQLAFNEQEHDWYEAYMKARGVSITPTAHVISWQTGGKIHWAVAFDQWCGRTCQLLSVSSSPRWAPREFLRYIYNYAFRCLDLLRLFAQIKSSNERALRMCLWMGFEEVFRAENCYSDGSDIVLLEMQRQNCHWIRD